MTPEQQLRAGRAVAQRMLLRDFTAQALADAAGVHPRTVRRLLRGERWPTPYVRRAIEDALGWKHGMIARHAIDGLDTLRGYTDAELAAELLRRAEAREEMSSI